jgi:acetylornithine aminotransferase
VPIPFNDLDALERALAGRDIAAFVVEPIQGKGVNLPSDDYLPAAAQLCRKHGTLLVADEVQTGMGRTGSLWAHEQLAVRPDVMTAAKALGGGLPVGACVTTPELGDVLGSGDHGSTFAGAPVTAAAALAALDVIDDAELLRSVRRLGGRLCDELADLDGVEEVRGRGLMIGAGLAPGIDAAHVCRRALDEGLVINVPAPATLRLLPPLTLTSDDVDEGVARLFRALDGARSRR